MATGVHEESSHEETRHELHQTEELIRSLLNATGEGIYGVDLEGDCTFANPACVQLLGFENDTELLGQNMHQLIHHTRPNGDPYPVEACRIYQAFREERGTHVGDEIVWRADGTSFPAEYWSHPVHHHDELVGAVVTFVDISERKQAEEDLRRSEATVRSVLNATGQGIYGVDLEGECTFANPACVQLLGFDNDNDLLGVNMHQLIHHTRPNGTAYPVEACRIYQAFREERGTHVGDEIVWRADGTSFPAEYWSYPLHHDGELTGCVVAFVDISERKRAEEELRQIEKLSALGKLSAGLAHELNNPAAAARRAAEQMAETLERLDGLTLQLSAHGLSGEQWQRLTELRKRLRSGGGGDVDADPLGQADREEAVGSWLDSNGVADAWQLAPVLVSGGLDRDALEEAAGELPEPAIGDAIAWVGHSLATGELVEIVARSTATISELVGAVKSYSYMDQAPVQEIDVHDGIDNTLTMLGYKLKRGTNVIREYDRTLPRITAPGGELNQVWMNLLDNAIDAAGDEGEIHIRTSRDGGEMVVEIVDNGPGVPAEVQGRIFDPFYTTKGVGQGTGLGLDVARRIVSDRCGGMIGFESEPGETRFWVRLPLDP
jgi:PAS domain S-box-containing protein